MTQPGPSDTYGGWEPLGWEEERAALRAQNAELVAALEEARAFVEVWTLNPDNGIEAGHKALGKIDAALAAAGQPQGSGE